MLEEALEIASHITHPGTIAVFVSVLDAYILLRALRAKKARILWVILAVCIVILGLAPLAASTFLQLRGIYRVRIVVLGSDHLPVDDAHVSSSIGGEPKKVESGWEFDIPPQSRPADGKLVLFASVKNAFLSGGSTLLLTQDYYPTTTIQLTSDTSAMIRGVVVDERRRSVAGARVSIPGYTEVALTDEMGNFVLAAHAADGQIVQVRAQKDGLVGSISVPAGKVSSEIVIKRP